MVNSAACTDRRELATRKLGLAHEGVPIVLLTPSLVWRLYSVNGFPRKPE
jgi:hypothetical protein